MTQLRLHLRNGSKQSHNKAHAVGRSKAAPLITTVSRHKTYVFRIDRQHRKKLAKGIFRVAPQSATDTKPRFLNPPREIKPKLPTGSTRPTF